MNAPPLLDTGPLVALLDRGDHYHRWTLEQMASLPSPLCTCEAVLTEAGARSTAWLTSPGTPGTLAPAMQPISRHWMGTARMGGDPRRSVCDPWQRLWDVDNVIVTDSSVFPTSTGYGPTLTLVALAVRAARALAGAGPLTSDRANAI